jgi:hypothetical protein
MSSPVGAVPVLSGHQKAAASTRTKVTQGGAEPARIQPKFDKEKARAAAGRIRESRKGISLEGPTIKDLVNEGRR